MSELVTREQELELDIRESNGLVVQLLYRKVAGTVLVHLLEVNDDKELKFPVPPDQALDAFRHPYAYAPTYSEAA